MEPRFLGVFVICAQVGGMEAVIGREEGLGGGWLRDGSARSHVLTEPFCNAESAALPVFKAMIEATISDRATRHGCGRNPPVGSVGFNFGYQLFGCHAAI